MDVNAAYAQIRFSNPARRHGHRQLTRFQYANARSRDAVLQACCTSIACNPSSAMFTTFNSLVRAIQEVQVEPANNSDNEVRALRAT